MSTDELLALRSVEVHRDGKRILGPVNWTVRQGQRWVILGPNGAGKTTLLQLAAAIIHPSKGSVEILGEQLGRSDLFELRPRVGFASSAMLDLLPKDEKVIDIVLTSVYGATGRWREEYDLWDESRASALLTIFGIRELRDRLFGTLSEGEKKRVQISRSLMPDPEILLLDEPAAGLDLGGREDILSRISEYSSDEKAPATIIVTHHIEEIPSGTSHVLLLKNGEIAHAGTIEETLTGAKLEELFGIPIQILKQGGRFTASSPERRR
jgi:iron complex transport system ATP-binding protein